ncbi:DUF2470 domain-containing protein [Actinocorallia longicatena]|uniref:DUF2470 domain-containing protein n=1 Tax=Actinocorallia longicatena TaxID=111803 RepID=A0ABP6QPQ9_9ACTN
MIHGPSGAERARTLAYGVAGGSLAALGEAEVTLAAHVTDEQGVPLMLVPAASPIVAALTAEPDLPATLRISDLTPVPLADRVRGRAWLHGWITEVPPESRREAAVRISRLHPRPDLLDLGARIPAVEEWTILALEVAEIEIEDVWGSAVVEPDEYADARPDPFVALEAGAIVHLDHAHRPELAALVKARFGELEPDHVVRAVALNRFGLNVRCLAPGREPFDLRFAFDAPARDLNGLRGAYRKLFATVNA